MESRVLKNTFALLALVAFAQSIPADSTPTAEAITPSTISQATPPSVNTPSSPPVTQSSGAVTPSYTTSGGSITNAVSETQSINDPALIPVDIYYEAKCSDSVNFIEKQFTPVYEKLHKFINVTFIPFAQGNFTDNPTTPHCVREGECEADRIHTCGINKINNKDNLVKFVTCALVEGGPKGKSVPTEECGRKSNVDNVTIASIIACSTDAESIKLLEKDKELSTAAQVKTVPRIVLGKVYSQDKQNLSMTNFLKVVCDMIPTKDSLSECKASASGSGTVVVGVLPVVIGIYYIINMF